MSFYLLSFVVSINGTRRVRLLFDAEEAEAFSDLRLQAFPGGGTVADGADSSAPLCFFDKWRLRFDNWAKPLTVGHKWQYTVVRLTFRFAVFAVVSEPNKKIQCRIFIRSKRFGTI